MKKCLSAALLLFWITGSISGQSRIIIEKLEKEKQRLNRQELTIDDSLQVLKLNDIRERLHEMGWPSSDPDLISHPGFVLAYDEEHEQAKWVAHIILKDIQSGSEGRTNKFMVDPLIKTGSAVDEDYFTKTPKPEGGYSYKGYGFDRGHLAPSADFKWSRSALAASYYYSNMSPQRPALNRGKWARLEGFLRDIVQQHNADVFVVTGPFLYAGMPKVAQSVNQMSLPERYWKVAYNPKTRSAIGFIMPNDQCSEPVEWYAVPVDSIEKATGFDFFKNLPDTLENRIEKRVILAPWLPDTKMGETLPLDKSELPKKSINTQMIKDYYLEEQPKLTVCGTVVSAHKSGKGHVFINLDKKFPETVFSATVWANDLKNFPYDLTTELMLKQVCITGPVTTFKGTPTTYISGPESLFILGEPEDEN